LCKKGTDEGWAKISSGALVVDVPCSDIPLMLRKSDGGYGYDSTDLAAITLRVQEWGAKWIIYVVGSEQELHFKAVYTAAKQNKLIPSDIRLDHCGFGMLLGADGKKIKSRSGETIKLRELLDEAQAQAKIRLQERLKDEASLKISEEEFENSAEVLGISSVK